jgi:peptidylprolyl isomerase
MPELRKLLPLLLAALALVLSACGDDDEDQSAAEPAAPAETQPAETTPAEEPAGDGEISKNLDEKPAIAQPTGQPPRELESEDIVTGKGATAKEGDNVTVQYVGVNFSNGAEFDASWNRGEPFEFTLGAGQVIPGWDEGVAGMKEGGRRKLTIPPDQAYGPQGSPPAIGPNETLVFVIDLEKVTKGTG